MGGGPRQLQSVQLQQQGSHALAPTGQGSSIFSGEAFPGYFSSMPQPGLWMTVAPLLITLNASESIAAMTSGCMLCAGTRGLYLHPLLDLLSFYAHIQLALAFQMRTLGLRKSQ